MQDLGVTFFEIGEVTKAISMHTQVLNVDNKMCAIFALSGNSKQGLSV